MPHRLFIDDICANGRKIYSSNVTSMCEQCLKIYPRTKTWNKLVDCVNVVYRICNLKKMSFILAIEKHEAMQ
jgi:hypothetical protein